MRGRVSVCEREVEVGVERKEKGRRTATAIASFFLLLLFHLLLLSFLSFLFSFFSIRCAETNRCPVHALGGEKEEARKRRGRRRRRRWKAHRDRWDDNEERKEKTKEKKRTVELIETTCVAGASVRIESVMVVGAAAVSPPGAGCGAGADILAFGK